MTDSTVKLREILIADIDRFNIESTKHKRLHRRAQAFLILITAATTIAAGLGLLIPGREREIQFLVLVLSASATAATAWAETRRARDLWQHEREVFYALKDIMRELDFRSALDPLTTGEVDEMFRRTNAILGSSTSKWSRILDKKVEHSTE